MTEWEKAKWAQNKDDTGIITDHGIIDTDPPRSVISQVFYKDLLDFTDIAAGILYKNNPDKYSEFKKCMLHILKKAEEND